MANCDLTLPPCFAAIGLPALESAHAGLRPFTALSACALCAAKIGLGTGRRLVMGMSDARLEFADQLAPPLLKRGQVALGPLLPQDAGLMFVWINDVEATSQDVPYRPMDGTAM